MDVDTDLQNPVQNPPQQQAQTDPPPDDPSPPTVPEDSTSTLHPLPDSDTNNIDAEAAKKLRIQTLTALSKTFGHIPDVPIFTQWETRKDCSNSAVHRSVMAGICGTTNEGTYSVAVSSVYKDDEDGGDVILYTGSGGRKKWTDDDPPKRLRLGPQTEDQSWEESPNRALIMSFHTGNPVRVIRSHKCPSQYAPLRGYRYDGLYRVTAYWTAKGCNGKKICRCRLERLPGQPPIPVRPITISASRRRLKKRLVSRNQTDTSPAQSARGTERESAESSSSPQQRAVSETFTMSEDLPEPGVLPTYRWHPKKNMLVEISASDPIQEDFEMGDEEEHRGEDDATLVQSEDGHLNERMETTCFSDEGN